MDDVVVVGGGVAGLSAALVLARARRSVVVVDAGQPRNATSSHVHGFLSRDGATPAELLAAGRAEVTGFGGRILSDDVTGAVRAQGGFEVQLAGGSPLRARRLLVATGVADDLPDLPGVADRWGRDVLHCPYCHGYEVRDRRLVVIARNAGSVEQALTVRQWSDDVVLLLHETDRGDVADDELRQCEARGVRVLDGRVEAVVVEQDAVTAVRLVDGTRVPCDAVFVTPVFSVRGSLLAALGAGTDDDGRASWVRVDPEGRTSIEGVYAAGNVTDPSAQLVTAAAAGSCAGIGINTDLLAEDAAAALRAVDRQRAGADVSAAGGDRSGPAPLHPPLQRRVG